MKYFSTFAGVGGMELLFPKEWKLVGYSEWDKYAGMVHKYHTPNIKNYGDISKIEWERIPDFDILTGGSPCQDFSIAGKRRGLGGSRSSLAWEFIRALRIKKPRYFIWENVKGALSSRSGWDFANLISAFSEEGYALWWQVLNAKDFGVPQNRERIFILGSRNGSPKEVFFERESSETTNGESGNELREQVANTLRTNYSNGRSNETYIQVEPYFDGRKGRKTIKAGRTPEIKDKDRVRRLMPIECERLMGWSDNHTKYGIDNEGKIVEISDSQRYKMCGNGCVPQCVKWIVENVILNDDLLK